MKPRRVLVYVLALSGLAMFIAAELITRGYGNDFARAVYSALSVR
jgi:hypothetical protein